MGETDKQKLRIEMEKQNPQKIPYWKVIAHHESLKIKVDNLDTCYPVFGERILDAIKSRGISINRLEEVVSVSKELKPRHDLLTCLKNLKTIKGNVDCKLSEYDFVQLVELTEVLTKKSHKDHWKIIFKNVCSGENDENVLISVQNLQNFHDRQIENAQSPCEHFFNLLSQQRIPLLSIHTALSDTKAEQAKKEFNSGIVELYRQLSAERK